MAPKRHPALILILFIVILISLNVYQYGMTNIISKDSCLEQGIDATRIKCLSQCLGNLAIYKMLIEPTQYFRKPQL